MTVGVVDYDAGNLTSVRTALNYLGTRFVITSEPDLLLKSDKVIFPGVGEAASAMNRLKTKELDRCLREIAFRGTPMLGICLGCQIIFDFSEENNTDCLGLIPGKVTRFPPVKGLKIPHMGWNRVHQDLNNPTHRLLFEGVPQDSSFYFVHSYYPVPSSEEVVMGSTEYGVRFSSAVSMNNIAAVQFHPEKSAEYGLKVLENFINRDIE